MASRAPRRNGCRHCVDCNHLFNWARSSDHGCAEAVEMWPASLASPTVYFMIRERQLNWQIHAAATTAQGQALWRPAATHSTPAPLLRRRALRPLCVWVPRSATGVDAADSVVYMCSVEVACRMPPQSARTPPPAPAPAPFLPPPPLVAGSWVHTQQAPALAVTLYRLETPPPQQEQPAKRLRLDTLPARPGHLVANAPNTLAHLPCSTSTTGYSSCCGMSTLTCAASAPPTAPLCVRLHPVACGFMQQQQQQLLWQQQQQQQALLWQQHQQHQRQQQAGSHDPHGVLAWLRKIRHMLEDSPSSVHC